MLRYCKLYIALTLNSIHWFAGSQRNAIVFVKAFESCLDFHVTTKKFRYTPGYLILAYIYGVLLREWPSAFASLVEIFVCII